MKRLTASTLIVSLALLLGGCSLAPSRRPVIDAGTSATSSIDASDAPLEQSLSQTRLSAGATVHMANGLTVRIPKDWTANLTRDFGQQPDVRGALGASGASELLVLQRRGSTLRIRISSSVDEQVAGLGPAGYRPVVASAEATVFEVPAGRFTQAPPLAVISTHVPRASFGLLLFEHTAGNTAETVEAVWRLLSIKGVAPPLTSITRL